MAGAGEWVDDVKNLGSATQVVHGGVEPDEKSGAILTPIFLSTTFVQESIDQYLGKGFSYSRTDNPTVKVLEEKIAIVESAAGACCFSTGMAATVTCFSAFLKAGDHCILTDCSYGGTNRAARVMFSDFGIEYSYVDFTDVEKVKAAIKPNTKLIFSESPANPTLTLNDVEAISKIAHSQDPPILHVCDSTFATPMMMKVSF